MQLEPYSQQRLLEIVPGTFKDLQKLQAHLSKVPLIQAYILNHHQVCFNLYIILIWTSMNQFLRILTEANEEPLEIMKFIVTILL